MNPSERSVEDDEVPQNSATSRQTFAQLLTEGSNALDTAEGDHAAQVDLQDALKKISKSVPFVLLLIFRFLMAYLTTFFSMLFVNIIQYRIYDVLDEQISLKSSTSRNTLWTLLSVAISLLCLIYVLSPFLIDVNVVERLALESFHPSSTDFISIIMMCYFTDSTLRLLVCTVKIMIYFLLNPRSTAADHHSATPFPNFACIQWQWDRNSLWSSIIGGFVEGAMSRLMQRHAPRQRDSDRNLTGLDRPEDESDLESGPLLNETGIRGGGGRRRLARSASREGATQESGGERERTSSMSSGSAQSTVEAIDHQYEVMSYMRLKKIFAAVDSFGAIYRSLLPMPVWVYYFASGPGSDVLPFCYLFIKGMIVIDQAALAFKASKSIVIEQLEFGSYATEEDITQSGSSSCSICFEAYYRPITLNCNHIFCQHCIYEWLDHENSCPVCRAEVSRDESSLNIRSLSASAVPVVM